MEMMRAPLLDNMLGKMLALLWASLLEHFWALTLAWMWLGLLCGWEHSRAVLSVLQMGEKWVSRTGSKTVLRLE